MYTFYFGQVLSIKVFFNSFPDSLSAKSKVYVRVAPLLKMPLYLNFDEYWLIGSILFKFMVDVWGFVIAIDVFGLVLMVASGDFKLFILLQRLRYESWVFTFCFSLFSHHSP